MIKASLRKSAKLRSWFIQQIGKLPLWEIEKKISCSNNVLWKGLRLGEKMSNEKSYLGLIVHKSAKNSFVSKVKL